MITVELEGLELKLLLDRLAYRRDEIYKLTFAIDGGLMVKFNEYIWSPPSGKVTDE